MSDRKIEITWSKVERKEPNYTAFSIEQHKEVKRISNFLVYNHFLVDAIKDFAKHGKAKELAKDHSALALMNRAFYFQSVVETCKIYNADDGYSLIKFINTLINNHKRIVWYLDLSVDDLRGIIKDLGSSEYSEAYDRIKIIRDEHLAHTDRSAKYGVVKLDDLSLLQGKAEKTINKLGNALYGTSTGFEVNQGGDVDLVFSKILAFDKLRKIVFDARLNGSRTIDVDDVLEIIRLRDLD